MIHAKCNHSQCNKNYDIFNSHSGYTSLKCKIIIFLESLPID